MPQDHDAKSIDEVFSAVCAGDRQAFATIIEELELPLRLTAAIHLPAAQLVDDVVQEAFITIYTRRHEYEPGTNLGAWCRQIVRNHARNHGRAWLRAQQKHHSHQLTEIIDEEIEIAEESLV